MLTNRPDQNPLRAVPCFLSRAIVSFYVSHRNCPPPNTKVQVRRFETIARQIEWKMSGLLCHSTHSQPPFLPFLFNILRFLVLLCPRLTPLVVESPILFFSLSLSILFLFCDYTVVPSSWRFLAAGKKTWSTSFVRGFLSPSSARPIKGKVLAPGTRATLASPGTPGFGCVTLRSLFARLQEIPPTYSKISPQLNLHLKNLFLRALFFFRAWGTFRGISAVDREAIVSFN